jgi:N-acetylglucosamine kinase-like BadF-type ATPase
MAYSFRMSYVLGFDGGGTKTECVLMDSSDHVVARTFAGPSNPTRIGVEPAVRAVEEAAHLALREASIKREAILAIGAGLAGTANPEIRQRTHAAMQAAFPGIPLTLLTDIEAALAAAGEGPVIVLLAGTGSFAIGRNAKGETRRAGGYGPASSDHGSAFDVGRRAIAAITNHQSRSEPLAPLQQQILVQLDAANWPELQRRAETAPDDVFPRIFPVIAGAADAGDEAMRATLRDAVRALSSLAAEAADHLQLRNAAFRVAKTGGMLGRSKFFDEQLDSALKQLFPAAELGGLRISPAEAAALAARG